MTTRTTQMTREIAASAIAACLISIVGAAATFYITGQLQAQTVANVQATVADHEVRIRVMETLVGRIDSNVQWLKEQEQRRNP